MRKAILSILLALSLSLFAATVTAPDWVDAAKRDMMYPTNKYYSGFASSVVTPQQNKAEILDRVIQNARINAVTSIQTTVEKTVERYVQNRQEGRSTSTIDIMKSASTTHTSIKDIPGLKTEQWENPKTGELYAFAYIRIVDLSNRLMRRIVANIAKAEVEIQNLENMANRGDKVLAKNEMSKVQSLLDDIESDQKIMLSVDASVTDEDISLTDALALKQRYQALVASLKNGIAICLICEAKLFETTYSQMANTIKGDLSSLGCCYVANPEQADWVITIFAKAREYNTATYGAVTSYICYIDANVSVDKVATSQRIYEDAITQKGTHTHNYTEAARDGYKTLTQKLSNLIKQHIQ